MDLLQNQTDRNSVKEAQRQGWPIAKNSNWDTHFDQDGRPGQEECEVA